VNLKKALEYGFTFPVAMQGKTNRPHQNVGDSHQIENALIKAICHAAAAVAAGFGYRFAHGALGIYREAKAQENHQ
jgi:hypothetical protein